MGSLLGNTVFDLAVGIRLSPSSRRSLPAGLPMAALWAEPSSRPQRQSALGLPPSATSLATVTLRLRLALLNKLPPTASPWKARFLLVSRLQTPTVATGRLLARRLCRTLPMQALRPGSTFCLTARRKLPLALSMCKRLPAATSLMPWPRLAFQLILMLLCRRCWGLLWQRLQAGTSPRPCLTWLQR